MSRACPDLSPPFRAANLNHKPLAFSTVGAKHIRAPTHWERPVQIYCCRSGLLHQVDRRRAIRNNHREKVRNFVWRSIICKFRIPRALVSDNGKQFDNPKFRDLCTELGIKITIRPLLIRSPTDKQKSL